MRKVAAIALFASLMLAVAPARADELRLLITDDAKEKSPEYLNFFGNFSTTLIEGLAGLKESGEWSPPSDHWVILLSPVLSMTGETLVEIHAIHSKDPRRLRILIATLSERSDVATVRTAARSAQRLIVETAARQQKHEEPPHHMGEVKKWQ